MKKRNHLLRIADFFGLVIVSAFFLLPFIWMILTSVKTEVEAIKLPIQWLPQKVQWANFIQAWESGPFMVYIRNSFVYSLGVILMQLVTTIPAAYAYAKFEFSGKTFLFYLTMGTMMIPSQLIFVPMYQMMSAWRLIDSFASLILPFSASAFSIFMMRQAFKNVSDELIEAARIDGMRELGIVVKIATPCAMASVTTFILFSFIGHWNDYFWPLIMTTKDTVRTLPIAIARLNDMEGGTNWPVLMAGNVILVIPLLMAFFIAQNKIVHAFTYMSK
jgi:sn-glycerol 3-phosphate transport system permease protein